MQAAYEQAPGRRCVRSARFHGWQGRAPVPARLTDAAPASVAQAPEVPVPWHRCQPATVHVPRDRSAAAASPTRSSSVVARCRAAPADPDRDELAATVHAVVFSNAEGSFTILRAHRRARREGRAQGRARPRARRRAPRRARGKWHQHAEHGWSFQVEHAEAIAAAHARRAWSPTSNRACTGSARSGRRRSSTRSARTTLRRDRPDPQVLFKVQHPARPQDERRTRSARSSPGWEEARAVRRVMLFLTSHGVTTGIAIEDPQAVRRHGARAAAPRIRTASSRSAASASRSPTASRAT